MDYSVGVLPVSGLVETVSPVELSLSDPVDDEELSEPFELDSLPDPAPEPEPVPAPDPVPVSDVPFEVVEFVRLPLEFVVVLLLVVTSED